MTKSRLNLTLTALDKTKIIQIKQYVDYNFRNDKFLRELNILELPMRVTGVSIFPTLKQRDEPQLNFTAFASMIAITSACYPVHSYDISRCPAIRHFQRLCMASG